MCKIMIFTNTTQVTQTKKLIEVVAKHITAVDRDGFGYAALKHDNTVFGERTTLPYKFKSQWSKDVLDVAFVEKVYNRFGTYEQKTKAMILHGRISTNDKTITNTHPINKDGWSLIHNGVVTHHGSDYKMQTTNDTEHVLHELMTNGIDGVAKNLTGYYAAAAFDPTGKLHIIRDDIASLYVASVGAIGSLIFGTSEALIHSVCKEMSWKHSKVEKVLGESYTVCENNVMLSTTSFKSRGYDWEEAQYAKYSLGRGLGGSWEGSWGGYADDDDWVEDEKGFWRRKSKVHKRADALKAEDEARAARIKRSNVIDLTGRADKGLIIAGKHTVQTSDEDTTDAEKRRERSRGWFLQEVHNYADSSYKFIKNGKSISCEAFLELNDERKLDWTVIRSDGTIVCPNDYESDRLYEGAV